MMKKLILLMMVLAMVAIVPAMASDNVSVYSKYAPIVMDTGDNMGGLYVSVMCQNNMFSKGIVVQKVNDASIYSGYTNGNRVSKEYFDLFTPIGDNWTIELLPNGKFDGWYPEGTYTLMLPDGDRSWPEYAVVTVSRGARADVTFIGHAFTMDEDAKETCDMLTITKALYGKVTNVNEYREMVLSQWSTWSDHKPNNWNQIAPNNKQTREVEHGGHWEGHGWNKHWVTDYETEYSYRTSAWSEWSINVPQGYTTHGPHANDYQHRVISEGTYVDVTGTVQGLVSCGHVSIPADYGNLHYNALFGDPVPGVFKDLIVSYDQNGVIGAKTVDEATDLVI